jgi:hypothetical protein
MGESMARSSPFAGRGTARLLITTLTAAGGFAAVAVSGAPALAATTCAPAAPFAATALSAPAPVAGARFGTPAATGDFNNDGYDDLAVGAPADAVGTVAAGTVSIYMGSATGLGAPRVITTASLNGAAVAAGQSFGAALAVADFTGDGRDELIVGIPGYTSGAATIAGAIGFFFGTATGPNATGTRYLQSTFAGKVEANDRFGNTLAAGDFTGDGLSDLAIGALGESVGTSTVSSGEVTVVKGQYNGLVTGWTVNQAMAGQQNEADDRFSAALAAGDVVGDANADLVVGAPWEDLTGDDVNTGAIMVYQGTANGFANGFTLAQGGSADERDDNFGTSLAVADFDQNGSADIAVGQPFETFEAGVQHGGVSVFAGPIASSSKVKRFVAPSDFIASTTSGDRMGATMAVGDADGDGKPDLLVSAIGTSRSGAANAGQVYVLRGDPGVPLRPERAIAQPDLGQADAVGDEFGSSMAIGDFNGDGRTDGVFGAQGETIGGKARAGRAVVVSGLAATEHSVEPDSATVALQSAPAGGAAVGPIRYAYVDNRGGARIAVQSDPDNSSSVIWDPNSPNRDAQLSGRPAIGQGGDGRGVVAFRSTRGDVWVRVETSAGSTAWGPWTNYGGWGITGLAMATVDGTLTVYGVRATGDLVVLRQKADGTFGLWQPTGIGGLTGDPVAVAVSGGTQLFVRDAADHLQTFRSVGTTFTACGTVGGDTTIVGTPSVVFHTALLLEVFATSSDHRLLTIGQSASGVLDPAWSVVQDGDVTGSPAAIEDWATGRITVAVRGGDNIVRYTTQTSAGGSTWGAATPLSGIPAVTDVAVVPYTSAVPSYLFTFRDGDGRQLIFYK